MNFYDLLTIKKGTFMKFFQKQIALKARERGFHLVTNEIVNSLPELKEIEKGMLQVFIKHTSASLTINENADSTVRSDLEEHFNRIAPDGASYYSHTMEGEDDMSAHIKSSTIGNSLSVPIRDGRLELGRWQGIYLCEHRDSPHTRRVFATINGEKG